MNHTPAPPVALVIPVTWPAVITFGMIAVALQDLDQLPRHRTSKRDRRLGKALKHAARACAQVMACDPTSPPFSTLWSKNGNRSVNAYARIALKNHHGKDTP